MDDLEASFCHLIDLSKADDPSNPGATNRNAGTAVSSSLDFRWRAVEKFTDGHSRLDYRDW